MGALLSALVISSHIPNSQKSLEGVWPKTSSGTLHTHLAYGGLYTLLYTYRRLRLIQLAILAPVKSRSNKKLTLLFEVIYSTVLPA